MNNLLKLLLNLAFATGVSWLTFFYWVSDANMWFVVLGRSGNAKYCFYCFYTITPYCFKSYTELIYGSSAIKIGWLDVFPLLI